MDFGGTDRMIPIVVNNGGERKGFINKLHANIVQ